MMQEITDRKNLVAWLKAQSRESAKIIALRSALRVLPLVARDPRNTRLHLAVFRAISIAWCTLNWPEEKIAAASSADAIDAVDAANAANSASKNPNAVAAACAAFAVIAANRVGRSNAEHAASAAAANAASAAAASASADRSDADEESDIWSELNHEIAILEKGTESIAGTLAFGALWLEEPEWVERASKRLMQTMLATDPQSDFWLGWYDRRRAGSRMGFVPDADADKQLSLRIAQQQKSFWDRKPAEVNAELKRWIEEAAARTPSPSDAADFFISYASSDEAIAREIASILDHAGYSYVVQFRDFVPGTNFVREMQRGLDGSARLIALLSPSYEASDHCQAEWSAAYAEDPGARNGKIVPFKIAEGYSNRLARQIVYKSLIGLTASERRIAVLEALGHWLKARRDAATIPVPDVAAENGLIVVKPGSPVGAERLTDFRTSELERLRDHSLRIRDTYPANTIQRPLRYVQDYVSQLDSCGADPDVEWLNDCIFPFAEAFKAIDRREWPDGFPDDVEGFLARHKRFTNHFDLEPREVTLDTVEADPERATSSAIAAPMREVEEAVLELSDAGLTSPELPATVRRQVVIAEQLDDSITDNPDSKAANDAIKGRFLFNQIGFYERLLMATGAVATISASPLLGPAATVIERAIHQLLALLA